MSIFREPSGTNFRLVSNIPATELSKALCRVASFIQAHLPVGNRLEQYDDWWQHDGLHFYKRQITLHQLFEMVQSPRWLLESSHGDHYVFVGVAPSSNDWYLRFLLEWDANDQFLEGRFDITVPFSLAETFRMQVVSSLSLEMIEQDAASYYRSLRV